MATSHKEHLRRALVHSLIRLRERAVHPCHPLSIASGKSSVNLQNKSLLCVYFSFLFYFFLETYIYYLGNEPPSKEQTVLWQKRWDILPRTSQKQCHWSSLCRPLIPWVVFNKTVFPWGTHFSSRERGKAEVMLCTYPRVPEWKPFCSMPPFSTQTCRDWRAGSSQFLILILRLLGFVGSVDVENKPIGSAEIRIMQNIIALLCSWHCSSSAPDWGDICFRSASSPFNVFIHHCGTQVPCNLGDVYTPSAPSWLLLALHQGWETEMQIYVKSLETDGDVPMGC